MTKEKKNKKSYDLFIAKEPIKAWWKTLWARIIKDDTFGDQYSVFYKGKDGKCFLFSDECSLHEAKILIKDIDYWLKRPTYRDTNADKRPAS